MAFARAASAVSSGRPDPRLLTQASPISPPANPARPSTRELRQEVPDDLAPAIRLVEVDVVTRFRNLDRLGAPAFSGHAPRTRPRRSAGCAHDEHGTADARPVVPVLRLVRLSERVQEDIGLERRPEAVRAPLQARAPGAGAQGVAAEERQRRPFRWERQGPGREPVANDVDPIRIA